MFSPAESRERGTLGDLTRPAIPHILYPGSLKYRADLEWRRCVCLIWMALKGRGAHDKLVSVLRHLAI